MNSWLLNTLGHEDYTFRDVFQKFHNASKSYMRQGIPRLKDRFKRCTSKKLPKIKRMQQEKEGELKQRGGEAWYPAGLIRRPRRSFLFILIFSPYIRRLRLFNIYAKVRCLLAENFIDIFYELSDWDL